MNIFGAFGPKLLCEVTCCDVNFCPHSDIYKIQEGISDKVAMLIQSYSNFITSCIIGFTKGWKVTLVILAVSPVMSLSAALYSKVNILLDYSHRTHSPHCSYNYHCLTALLAGADNFHCQRAECIRQGRSHSRGGAVRRQDCVCLQRSEQRDQKVQHKLLRHQSNCTLNIIIVLYQILTRSPLMNVGRK